MFRQAATDMYYKNLAFNLLECQFRHSVGIEGGLNEAHRLRQAAIDMYFKTLTF